MTPSPSKTAILVTGPGNSGKSTFVHTLRYLLSRNSPRGADKPEIYECKDSSVERDISRSRRKRHVLCIYLLPPSSFPLLQHSSRESFDILSHLLDLASLSSSQRSFQLLPILSKIDSYTLPKLSNVKQECHDLLTLHNEKDVWGVICPDVESLTEHGNGNGNGNGNENEEEQEEEEEEGELAPLDRLASLCAERITPPADLPDAKALVRSYPWGVCHPLNPEHSDLAEVLRWVEGTVRDLRDVPIPTPPPLTERDSEYMKESGNSRRPSSPRQRRERNNENGNERLHPQTQAQAQAETLKNEETILPDAENVEMEVDADVDSLDQRSDDRLPLAEEEQEEEQHSEGLCAHSPCQLRDCSGEHDHTAHPHSHSHSHSRTHAEANRSPRSVDKGKAKAESTTPPPLPPVQVEQHPQQHLQPIITHAHSPSPTPTPILPPPHQLPNPNTPHHRTRPSLPPLRLDPQSLPNGPPPPPLLSPSGRKWPGAPASTTGLPDDGYPNSHPPRGFLEGLGEDLRRVGRRDENLHPSHHHRDRDRDEYANANGSAGGRNGHGGRERESCGFCRGRKLRCSSAAGVGQGGCLECVKRGLGCDLVVSVSGPGSGVPVGPGAGETRREEEGGGYRYEHWEIVVRSGQRDRERERERERDDGHPRGVEREREREREWQEQQQQMQQREWEQQQQQREYERQREREREYHERERHQQFHSHPHSQPPPHSPYHTHTHPHSHAQPHSLPVRPLQRRHEHEYYVPSHPSHSHGPPPPPPQQQQQPQQQHYAGQVFQSHLPHSHSQSQREGGSVFAYSPPPPAHPHLHPHPHSATHPHPHPHSLSHQQPSHVPRKRKLDPAPAVALLGMSVAGVPPKNGSAANGGKGPGGPSSRSGPKVVACNYCRARKTRCDGSSPCTNCAKRNLSCEYVAFGRESARRRKARLAMEANASSAAEATNADTDTISNSNSTTHADNDHDNGSAQEMRRSVGGAGEREDVPLLVQPYQAQAHPSPSHSHSHSHPHTHSSPGSSLGGIGGGFSPRLPPISGVSDIGASVVNGVGSGSVQRSQSKRMRVDELVS